MKQFNDAVIVKQLNIENTLCNHVLHRHFGIPNMLSRGITPVCLWTIRLFSATRSIIRMAMRPPYRRRLWNHFVEFFVYSMYRWELVDLYGPSMFFDCKFEGHRPYFEDRTHAVLLFELLGIEQVTRLYDDMLNGLLYPQDLVGLLLPAKRYVVFSQIDIIMNYIISTRYVTSKENDMKLIESIADDILIIPEICAVVEYGRPIGNVMFPNDVVHVKPSNSAKGRGHFQIDCRDKSVVEIFNEFPKDGQYVASERVINTEYIRQFTGCEGLSTLRILTMCYNGRVYLFGIKGRVPTQPNSVTDNTSCGGIGFSMNTEGFITTHGEIRDKYKGNEEVHCHPVTGTKFKGQRIPGVKQAVEAAVSLHEKLSTFYNGPPMYIGWDIAVTDKGPVYIEMNHGAWCGAQGTVGNFMENNADLMAIIMKDLTT